MGALVKSLLRSNRREDVPAPFQWRAGLSVAERDLEPDLPFARRVAEMLREAPAAQASAPPALTNAAAGRSF